MQVESENMLNLPIDNMDKLSPRFKRQSLNEVEYVAPEDAKSSNRSTTTTGAGLANKIGQAMSRIIAAPETDEDITEFIQLVDELNQSQDLTVKFKTNSKIIKYLVEANQEKTTTKDYRNSVNKQVNEFGKLAFGSKMRSMEAQGGNSFDPKVTELITAC